MNDPIRVLRQIVRPNGRHRSRPLLLDETFLQPDVPVHGTAVSEAELAHLIDEGAVEPLESATCPVCNRYTPHARQADNRLRCWECGTTVTAEVA